MLDVYTAKKLVFEVFETINENIHSVVKYLSIVNKYKLKTDGNFSLHNAEITILQRDDMCSCYICKCTLENTHLKYEINYILLILVLVPYQSSDKKDSSFQRSFQNDCISPSCSYTRKPILDYARKLGRERVCASINSLMFLLSRLNSFIMNLSAALW